MILTALISAYKEGPLVHGAIRSALKATPNVIVFEGPAGMEADGPETDYSQWDGLIQLHRGKWKTDAKKRTAMLEATRQWRPEPVWGIWIDGDEILVNGEYVQDWVQLFLWNDDADKKANPEAVATMGWPIRLVEPDGTVAWCRGRVVRCDLIDGYSVSSSVFKNALGYLEGQGSTIDRFSDYWEPRTAYMIGGPDAPPEMDRMFAVPPLPCEPHLFHRSFMRHPDRRTSRLHEQEPGEIEKAKKEAGAA